MPAVVATGDLLAPEILIVLTGTISFILFRIRRKHKVNALDFPAFIFFNTSIMGIMQILKLYFSNEWAIFKYASDLHSLPLDPVRFMHLVVLMTIYLMSESFLTDNFSNKRTVVITFLLSIYAILSLLFIRLNTLVYFDDIFGFGKHLTLDSFIFDSIQMFISVMIFYVYYQQIVISENDQIKNNLRILLLALALFVFASFLELMEAFLPFDFNGFVWMLPVFIVLAGFYIKNPNFVYLAPSRVQFLQIISNNGETLYAAELREGLGSNDFLISPALIGINSMLGEIVGQDDLKVKKFEYHGGNILFEQIGDVQVIIQTDRPAHVLRRAMRYFLRVFQLEFSDQILNYKGYIGVNDKNISPDDVLRMCIPMISGIPMISSYHKDNDDSKKKDDEKKDDEKKKDKDKADEKGNSKEKKTKDEEINNKEKDDLGSKTNTSSEIQN